VNRQFTAIAVVLSAVALFLPTRSQTFTTVVIDGHAMRMLVAGSGESTVVFENGAGAPLETWGKVQPDVSRFATTVTYDRAGVGLSEDGPPPRDGRRIAVELRRALRAAGIAPPYILVGTSLGGPYIRIFAGLYPDDVAGMVLVDPTPHDERVELQVSRDTLDQARASRVPIGIPVLLIDAISPLDVPFATEAIRRLRLSYRADLEAESLQHRKWLDTIPGSRLIVTRRSGHNVPVEEPELVIEGIRDVVRQARNRRAR
jgi:pimeloyl-ACP methyl ester carboxylesterase